MDRVNWGPVKGLRLAIAAFVLTVVLLAATGGLTAYVLVSRSNDVQSFAEDLRGVLVRGCEENGNPLREAEVEDLQEGITDPDDPRIELLFPNVPKVVADEIIREGNRHRRERIEKLHPIDCQRHYPVP